MRTLAICALCVIVLSFGTGVTLLNGCAPVPKYDIEYYMMPRTAEMRVTVLQTITGRRVDMSLTELERVENVADLFHAGP